MLTTPLVFYVNQKKIVLHDVSPETTLISFLRRNLHLTGTKLACGEGGCGACTVMVSRVLDRSKHTIQHLAVNACLAPLVSVHGAAVTTIEGISGGKGGLHPLQERLAKCHGSQCGFCTPGIIMAAYALLRTQPDNLCQKQIEDALQGNLCRCTGYRPILESLRSFTCCGNPENCCKKPEASAGDMKLPDWLPYEPSQEPIFPNELQLTEDYDKQELEFHSSQVTWYRPCSLQRLLQLKSDHPEAKIVNGNTELGIEVHIRKQPYSVYIEATRIKELNDVQFRKDGLYLGAAATLTSIQHECKRQIADESVPDNQKRFTRALVEMLHWFAGPQIRNVASIGGNIMTASPISDLNPLLMAASAILTFQNQKSESRQVKMDNNFFSGYRKTTCNSHEILISVLIPYMKEQEYFYGFKQSRRREDDIAIVNAGMRVCLNVKMDSIVDVCVAYGGVAATTTIAEHTCKTLIGLPFNDKIVETAHAMLDKDIEITASAPGGQASYRKTLIASFFLRFYNLVCKDIGLQADSSSLTWIEKKPSFGTQVFDLPPDGQLQADPVGRPLVHTTAFQQTTGEAIYIDDMPEFSNELFLAPVLSQVASAKIDKIDYSEALKMAGVHGVVDHKDVPGSNHYGEFDRNERTFVELETRAVGEIVAGVLATDRAVAKEAAGKVVVHYTDIKKPVISIADAIQENSFYKNDIKNLESGDVISAFAKADHIIEGNIHIGGQEHFYFEPQSSLICPKENGEIEAFIATQNPMYSQSSLAEILGVSRSRVAVRVKRIGGGFGGKEMRSMLVSGPAAVAARKFNRPVRCVLDRDEDMACTGTRHPVYATYKLAAAKDGRLLGFEATYYLNGGYSLDLSANVGASVIWASTNAYDIPNVKVSAIVCKTNTSSNTAFRAFGSPQAIVVIEKAMSEMAELIRTSQTNIRELNLVKSGDVRPNGQVLKNCTVQRCWFECKQISDYDKRSKDIEEFNKNNRYKKRNIAMAPLCFSIGFRVKFLHQGGALVNIYTDGSVLVTHGGVEMGQGLHTKIIQVASRVLNIPTDKIFISETATDKIPNTTASAASMTTDLNAPAVQDACQQLKERLSPFMHANPKGTWEEWVIAAYFDGIDLSAKGFFNDPDIQHNPKTLKGNPFAYFVYGSACTEVELDVLTGDHVVRSTDIVMDLGASLNPAIDIGQIEGAFVQGYGLYTLEEQRFSPSGHLLTKGPGTYKIPGFSDIPERMTVHILKGSLCENPRSVYSSKAVGEPPLLLAVSVYSALRQAVRSARQEFGQTTKPLEWTLDSPATTERLRLAVNDAIASKFLESCKLKTNEKPWSVLLSDA